MKKIKVGSVENGENGVEGIMVEDRALLHPPLHHRLPKRKNAKAKAGKNTGNMVNLMENMDMEVLMTKSVNVLGSNGRIAIQRKDVN